jgi:hypothetical protein
MKDSKKDKILKSYSPIKSGMFYSVSSKYYIPKNYAECFFILSNNSKKHKICITDIFLTSVVTTMWDIKFNEIYIDGGSKLNLIPFNRSKQDEEDYPKDINAISLDRDNFIPITKVGNIVDGFSRVTPNYKTEEILNGSEIILGESNSLSIYVRQESGVNAPVNCEIRFYLE